MTRPVSKGRPTARGRGKEHLGEKARGAMPAVRENTGPQTHRTLTIMSLQASVSS